MPNSDIRVERGEMKHSIVYVNEKRLIAFDHENDPSIGFGLIDPDDKGGTSYAHAFPELGTVMRFQEKIADYDDIQWTEDEEEVTTEDILSGIQAMFEKIGGQLWFDG